MAIDWDNNLIDSLFCKYTFWNPTYRYNRLENCCFSFDRLVHCEVTSATNLLQRSIMAYRSLVWSVIRSVMIVEIFEQKHRSEHKKKCPRIDKFYRCLLLHLFPNGACKWVIKHALNNFGHKITKKTARISPQPIYFCDFKHS